MLVLKEPDFNFNAQPILNNNQFKHSHIQFNNLFRFPLLLLKMFII